MKTGFLNFGQLFNRVKESGVLNLHFWVVPFINAERILPNSKYFPGTLAARAVRKSLGFRLGV